MILFINDLEKISKWAYQWKMSFNSGISKQAQEVLLSQKRGSRLAFAIYGLVQILGCGWPLTKFLFALNDWENSCVLGCHKKYLWSYGCSSTNFKATVNFTNPKNEIKIEIIETQIIGIQIYILIKKNIPFKRQTCLFAVN